MNGADTVSDTVGRTPGSQISVARGTVHRIKSYREQVDQHGAQQSDAVFTFEQNYKHLAYRG